VLSTQIVGFTVEPLSLPLPTPFETAHARRTKAQNLLLTVELAGGERGIGEVAPAPHVTGEDQEGSRQILAGFAPRVVGADVTSYRRISSCFQEAHPRAHAARAGLEAALLDAYCRRLGIPLYQFFGGACAEISTDITIPIVPPAEASAAARLSVQRGFQDLKVKIGAGGQDFERILAAAGAAPGVRIRLDGNQGLSPEGAVALLHRVQDAGVNVALFEQPLQRDDLDGLRYVRERVSVPIAADESVITPQDAYRVARANAVDVVNIKLMKAGVLGALEIIGVCRAAGIGLMLGCMLESRLGISVAAHLAAGTGVFDFLDLDGHLLTGDTRTSGGFEQCGNRMVLSANVPGNGITSVLRD
jgi:L-alanine-DL-glutamate epimerase-like enolase superfamily enzyme